MPSFLRAKTLIEQQEAQKKANALIQLLEPSAMQEKAAEMSLTYNLNAIQKNAPENIDSRVLSPMSLGSFTFSKRMPNEDEYSH